MKLNPSDSVLAVRQIDPDSYSAGTTTGASIDVTGWEYALIVASIGDMGSGSTVTVRVQDSDTAGTGTNIAGAEMTLTQAGGDNDSVKVGQVRLGPLRQYLRCLSVVASAASDVQVTVILFGPDRQVDLTDAAGFEFEV